jgi:hypothetical protein
MQEPTVSTRAEAEALKDGQTFWWNGRHMKKKPGGADLVR